MAGLKGGCVVGWPRSQLDTKSKFVAPGGFVKADCWLVGSNVVEGVQVGVLSEVELCFSLDGGTLLLAVICGWMGDPDTESPVIEDFRGLASSAAPGPVPVRWRFLAGGASIKSLDRG